MFSLFMLGSPQMKQTIDSVLDIMKNKGMKRPQKTQLRKIVKNPKIMCYESVEFFLQAWS
jgi:hypothetical protein